ncbi:hypothetical protein [uncultured Paludibaculum sp.]|uniref:hypothetical protein n=1 Tax=uncultured Paludibaculum sp. TaxID=1765020 RepID=UPI002AAA8427|nr:hypothetical protein [uncultured Paludibaculum sp.]
MALDTLSLQPAVAAILDLDASGERLLPLTCGSPTNPEAVGRLEAAHAAELFPGARSPEGALAGLWVYFSCFEHAHSVAQDLHTPEGSYWHAIVHRQEPDDFNSGYWFRRVGTHAIFSELLAGSRDLGYEPSGSAWDPFAFIEFCAAARNRAGTATERVAREVQRLEWQLLFGWCARVRR